MDQVFTKKLEAYEKQILYAGACNKCYFEMKYGDKEWERVYEIAPAFFQFARKGMQSEAFLTIGKMFEKGSRSDNNFHRLLNYVQSNAEKIYPEKHEELTKLAEEYQVELGKASKVAEKILFIRDKMIAHNDNDFFDVSSNNKNVVNLSYEEVNALLELAGKIVNGFNQIINHSSTHMHYSNEDDLKKLMNFCLRHMSIDG